MNNKPKLQLIYFHLRALAEAPQMLMKYANISYSYEMAWDFFGKPWGQAKKDVPFQLLPLLVVDGKYQIWESGAIIRYLANINNMIPKDSILAAKIDAVFESTQELFFPLNPIVNVWIKEKHITAKNQFLIDFPLKLKKFAKILENYNDGPFFFGKIPYYCDFSAYHHFSLARKLDAKILNHHPLILHFMNSIEKLPGVKEYLLERPKIIGIGSDPKLVINNKEYLTYYKEYWEKPN